MADPDLPAVTRQALRKLLTDERLNKLYWNVELEWRKAPHSMQYNTRTLLLLEGIEKLGVLEEAYRQGAREAQQRLLQVLRDVQQLVVNVQGKAIMVPRLTPEGQDYQTRQIERELEYIHTQLAAALTQEP